MAADKKINYVILGLLSHESLTGYEIKKRVDTTLKYFWRASFGNIYPALNKLVQEHMISKYEKTENGRDKIIYTIEETGREHLREWLALPAARDDIHFETLLKLFFGSEAAEGTALSHILRFEGKALSELPYLKQSVKQLETIQNEDDTHTHYMLTAMFGVKIYEAYLEWCEEAKQLIKGRDL